MYIGSYLFKTIRTILFMALEPFGYEALVAGDLLFIRLEDNNNYSNLIGSCFM
jgi:hypothetical protein